MCWIVGSTGSLHLSMTTWLQLVVMAALQELVLQLQDLKAYCCSIAGFNWFSSPQYSTPHARLETENRMASSTLPIVPDPTAVVF